MKTERQQRILSLIRQKPIETQEELAEELRMLGLVVTQATVSRDIHELGLVKVPFGENRHRYALPQIRVTTEERHRLLRLFRESVVSLDSSGPIIVVKSLPGTAQAVGASIDSMDWPEVIGTVAGDDTLMIIVKPPERVIEILGRFVDLME